jgi:pimeloyl-ACP methyl ester carboxylesterase
VEGTEDVVVSDDGTPIGTLTAGSGPPLLLVHGGLSGLERWAPLWERLVPRFRITAMDRRGRGRSLDTGAYDVAREYADVWAVAARTGDGGPVDALGHSFGGICLLGAAGRGAPLRRLALYEPPGPPTVPAEWHGRMQGYLEAGRTGRAVVSFLTEVVGLSADQVDDLRRSSAGGGDVMGIAERTFVREADALLRLDLAGLACRVRQPVLLMRGTASPPWAAEVVDTLAAHLPDARVEELAGHGHEGVDTATDQVAGLLARFLAEA